MTINCFYKRDIEITIKLYERSLFLQKMNKTLLKVLLSYCSHQCFDVLVKVVNFDLTLTFNLNIKWIGIIKF